MPTIILIGDSDTGHDHHGPTKVITGSSTVKVDGKAVARLGDTLAPHGSKYEISFLIKKFILCNIFHHGVKF